MAISFSFKTQPERWVMSWVWLGWTIQQSREPRCPLSVLVIVSNPGFYRSGASPARKPRHTRSHRSSAKRGRPVCFDFCLHLCLPSFFCSTPSGRFLNTLSQQCRHWSRAQSVKMISVSETQEEVETMKAIKIALVSIYHCDVFRSWAVVSGPCIVLFYLYEVTQKY